MKTLFALGLIATALSVCGGDESAPEELLMAIPVTGGEVNAISGSDLCDTEPTAGPTVLFLHGASFNATTWVETGTHQLLCAAGIPSLSIDLPGFGRSPRFDHEPVRLLNEVTAWLGSDVILVSPSMSGGYSLPWLATRPPLAVGFVPLAPVGIGDWTTPDDFHLPTLGIWGSNDRIVPVSEGQRLIDSIPGAGLLVVDGGGHAVYKTNPAEFHEAFMGFVERLRP
jgi:pimeloyl-ACP methyl ester carboxylesterase